MANCFMGVLNGIGNRHLWKYPGVTAFSLTLLGVLQPIFLSPFIPRDSSEDLHPSIHTLGMAQYCYYVGLSILFYNIVFFTVEMFNFFNWQLWAECVGGSSLLTFVLLLVLENLRSRLWKTSILKKRRLVLSGVAIFIIVVYLVRLFCLQIMSDDYRKSADSNAFLKKIEYPSRGLITDRKGKLLVYNQPAYDIMVVMNEEKGRLDTTEFCKALNITKDFFIKRMADIKDRSKKSRLFPIYSTNVHESVEWQGV